MKRVSRRLPVVAAFVTVVALTAGVVPVGAATGAGVPSSSRSGVQSVVPAAKKSLVVGVTANIPGGVTVTSPVRARATFTRLSGGKGWKSKTVQLKRGDTVVKGMTAGATYKVTVGGRSTKVKVVSAVGAVTDLSVARGGDTAANVGFAHKVTPQMGKTVGYVVVAAPSDVAATATMSTPGVVSTLSKTRSVQVAGLNPDTLYTFTVRAYNPTGYGPSASWAMTGTLRTSGTTGSVDGAPSDVPVTAVPDAPAPETTGIVLRQGSGPVVIPTPGAFTGSGGNPGGGEGGSGGTGGAGSGGQGSSTSGWNGKPSAPLTDAQLFTEVDRAVSDPFYSPAPGVKSDGTRGTSSEEFASPGVTTTAVQSFNLLDRKLLTSITAAPGQSPAAYTGANPSNRAIRYATDGTARVSLYTAPNERVLYFAIPDTCQSSTYTLTTSTGYYGGSFGWDKVSLTAVGGVNADGPVYGVSEWTRPAKGTSPFTLTVTAPGAGHRNVVAVKVNAVANSKYNEDNIAFTLSANAACTVFPTTTSKVTVTKVARQGQTYAVRAQLMSLYSDGKWRFTPAGTQAAVLPTGRGNPLLTGQWLVNQTLAGRVLNTVRVRDGGVVLYKARVQPGQRGLTTVTRMGVGTASGPNVQCFNGTKPLPKCKVS